MRGLQRKREGASSLSSLGHGYWAVSFAALVAVSLCPAGASARDAFSEDAFSTYKANVDNGCSPAAWR
jgi:hypothetical protein